MSENKREKKGFWSSLFAPGKSAKSCDGGGRDAGSADAEIRDTPDGRRAEEGSGMVITVLGTGCSSCRALYNTVREAVAQSGIDAKVEKEEDLEKIMAYGVMSLPALAVDGKVVSKGKKLSIAQVREIIG